MPRNYVPALVPRSNESIRSSHEMGLREFTFKSELIRQARIEPRHRVFDQGSGTATLTLLVKKQHPEAKVVGIDEDI